MSLLRRLARNTPGVERLYRSLRGLYVSVQMKRDPARHVFTDIYRRRFWGDQDSVSGPGSDFEQTRAVTEELPRLLRELDISTLFDIPCGDFHWMSNVELGQVDYLGADIVKQLIRQNEKRYQGPGRRFRCLNLIEDPLPEVDLVLCRDCLVHFSFEDLFKALRNLCRSRSRYLLTTHFPACTENRQIATGDWRALNLVLAPFLLPEPRRVITENCTLEGGLHGDKCLALWELEEIRAALEQRGGDPPWEAGESSS